MHRPIGRVVRQAQPRAPIPGHEARFALQGRRPTTTPASAAPATSAAPFGAWVVVQGGQLGSPPVAVVGRGPPEAHGGVGPEQGAVGRWGLVGGQAVGGVRAVEVGAGMWALR